MFFAWIVVSFVTFNYLPWWGIFPVAAVVGYARPAKWTLDILLAGVCAAVCSAMAFYADGRSFGVISQRMAGLFSLPRPELMFVVMFGLAFISCLLSLQSGSAMRQIFAQKKGVLRRP